MWSECRGPGGMDVVDVIPVGGDVWCALEWEMDVPGLVEVGMICLCGEDVEGLCAGPK